jgi:hypothetical protein
LYNWPRRSIVPNCRNPFCVYVLLSFRLLLMFSGNTPYHVCCCLPTMHSVQFLNLLWSFMMVVLFDLYSFLILCFIY